VQRDDGVAAVVLAAQQAFEIEPVEGGFDLRQLRSRLAGRLFALFVGELEIDLRVLELRELLAPALERRRQRRAFAQNRLCFLAVAPEVGLGGRLIQLAQPCLSLGDVKDTSRKR
jgi:hypothetical protein